MVSRGDTVVALSRKDAGGTRTRDAIQVAALGCGLPLPSDWRSRVEVEHVDFGQLAATLPLRVLEGAQDVWNFAAEMAYSRQKIEDAVSQNVKATTTLYDLASHTRGIERFNHVSTAYVSGTADGYLNEELHRHPRFVNSYQISKWMGELALAQSHALRGLPLTVLRPSIVIGHSATGWSSGGKFGFYMFLEGIRMVRDFGLDAVQVDIRPLAQVNLIPVDVVVARCLALADSSQRSPFEIVHAVADGSLAAQEMSASITALSGVAITFGPERTPVDARFNRAFQANKSFADETWHFGTARIRRILGDRYVPFHMTQDILGRSIAAFLSHPRAEPHDTRARFTPEQAHGA
jgi:nucleoside-diphosphate-sugar epimerase